MIRPETFINFIILFLITVVFGYFLGLTITQVVDHRLSDISINMPKINLPKSDVYVNYDPDSIKNPKWLTLRRRTHLETESTPETKSLIYQYEPSDQKIKPLVTPEVIDQRSVPQGLSLDEGFDSNITTGDHLNSETGSAVSETRVIPNSKELPLTQSVQFKDHDPRTLKVVPAESIGPVPAVIRPGKTPINPIPIIDPNPIPPTGIVPVSGGVLNPNIVNQEHQNLENQKSCLFNQNSQRLPPKPICESSADCNQGVLNGPNRCLANKKCQCVTGSGPLCVSSATYYKDPRTMTTAQKMKFKYKSKFEKMTVQDYINWLNLFAGIEEELSMRHLDNYRKLQKGGLLSLADIPRDRLTPPLSAQQYFEKLYAPDDQIGLYTPYNSDMAGLQIPANFSNYSYFEPPRNLKHLNSHTLSPYEQLDKVNHRDVLKTIQPQISQNWDYATGTSVDESGLGIREQQKADNVQRLGFKIAPAETYPDN